MDKMRVGSIIYRFFCTSFLIVGLLYAVVSCESDMPDGILDEKTMENVLYDYHIAQSLAKTQPKESTGYDMRYYVQAVWEKYHITEETFNHSLEWYSKNSEQLYKIYQKIDERYAGVTDNQQGGIPHQNSYQNQQGNGDTINVWKDRDMYLLISQENNYMSFDWEADSILHEGDQLLLHFNTKWYYREGEKMATLQLNLRYLNDSVVTINRTIYNTTGLQDIYVNTDKTMRVKSVSGLIYQEAMWNERPKLLLISDFALVRFRHHRKDDDGQNVVEEPINTTSEIKMNGNNHIFQRNHLKDSLLYADSINKVRPHFSEIKVEQPLMNKRRIKRVVVKD